MSTSDLSVIGLGLMGRAIAERLQQSGLQVSGFNRSTLEHLPTGVALYASATEAIAASPVSWLMLSDAEACKQVLLSARDVLADRWILNGSTIGPDQSRELAGLVSEAGGHYVETPVLGSTPQAHSGTLQILVGGSELDVAHVDPILKALGHAERFGDVGAGAVVKLAMNQLIGSLTAAFAMSLGLVLEEGVAVDRFMATLRESALYAPTFDKKLQKMLDRDFAQANFPLKHLLKDIRLFTRAAGHHDIDNHLLIGLQHILEDGVYSGHGEHDYSALFEGIVHRVNCCG